MPDRRGWRDRRAATAVVFALSIFPVMALAALAIDAGTAMSAKARLDLAADAAVLAGVTTANNALGVHPGTYLTLGQQAGALRFAAQAGQINAVSTPLASVALNRSGPLIVGQANWSATYTTRLGALFGVPSWPMSGTSSARVPISTPYMDITVMFDTSASMEVASTTAGMAALGTAVSQSAYFAQWGQNQLCALACHWDANSHDFYGVARANNIELRFDVILAALQQVITTVTAKNTSGQLRMAVYTFNLTLNTVVPLTGDLGSVQSTMSALQMPVDSVNGTGNTDFSDTMTR